MWWAALSACCRWRDLHFIVDAMQRYDDLGEMRELSRRLGPLQVICIEDPLPKDSSNR